MKKTALLSISIISILIFTMSLAVADTKSLHLSSTGTDPCSITINQDLSFTIPNAIYDAGPPVGQMALSVDFLFFGEQNGQLLWQLSNADSSPSSSACTVSVFPDLSFTLTDAVYNAGPLDQMTLQADFQYYGEQNGSLLWFLADLKVDDAPSSTCGAYVAPGVWKQFECYNLATIGKTTGADPFTPSWELIGGYWQWGRKGPDPSQWYYTNTPNFAHGPNGPNSGDANDGEITGWDQANSLDDSWSDASKSINDPCPQGFQMPTASQWDGVRDNNPQSAVGTWSSKSTNYSSARFFGSDLMLPAAGSRNSSGKGWLNDRGDSGSYWSSSESSAGTAWYLYHYSNGADANIGDRREGFSVRCIKDAASSQPDILTLDKKVVSLVSGDNETVVVSGKYESFTVITSDSKVVMVTVTENGIHIEGILPGTATVMVEDDSGRTATVIVTVLPTDPGEVEPFVLESHYSLTACDVRLTFPGIAASVVTEDGVRYHQLKLPGGGASAEEGKPELPFYTVFFALPQEQKTSAPANWKISVNAEQTKNYAAIRPYPGQAPAWLNDTQDEGNSFWPDFSLDEAFYASSGSYPDFWYQAKAVQIGNLHALEVRLFPARYYPAERRLLMAEQLRIQLDFSSPGKHPLVAPGVMGDYAGNQQGSSKAWIADIMMNSVMVEAWGPNDLVNALPPMDFKTLCDEGFELLIVTRPELYAQAYRLGRYRQDTGTRTCLISLPSTTYPDCESVRDVILDKDKNNLFFIAPGSYIPYFPLSAICIFGDTEIIPTCEGMNERKQDDPGPGDDPVSIVGTDLFYSTIRGSDNYPDVAIGRISVDYLTEAEGVIDLTEAEGVIDKIIAYESAGNANHAAVYSYFDDNGALDYSGNINDDGQDNWVFMTSAERFRQFMNGQGVTCRFGYARNSSRTTPTHMNDGSPLHADLASYGWNPTTAELSDNWRQGLDGIIFHSDHGHRQGWSHPWFHADDLDHMLYDSEWNVPPPTTYYPIVFSLNCSSGYFDNETDLMKVSGTGINPEAQTMLNYDTTDDEESFAERALIENKGGGVAVVAASRGSTSHQNNILLDGLMLAFYDDYTHGSNPFQARRAHTRLGAAFLAAKHHMYIKVYRNWSESSAEYNAQIYHLFGDPMLKLRLPEPLP